MSNPKQGQSPPGKHKRGLPVHRPVKNGVKNVNLTVMGASGPVIVAIVIQDLAWWTEFPPVHRTGVFRSVR